MSTVPTRTGVFLALVMLLGTIQPLHLLSDEVGPTQDRVDGEDSSFVDQGFVLEQVSRNSVNAKLELQRPEVSWNPTSGMGLEISRTHGCMVKDSSNELVYFFAGRTDPDRTQSNDEEPSDIVETFDTSTMMWSSSTLVMPKTQQYHECVRIGDKVYAIGDWYPGTSPGTASTGRMQILNLTTNVWDSTPPTMPFSKEVGNFGMAAIGENIYIAGGVQNASANDATDRLLRYNTSTGIWTELASMSEERYAFPLVAYDGLLYAFGGIQGPYTWSSKPVLNTSEVYNPSTNAWTKLTNMSFHRFGMAATVHNNEIVLIGGHSKTSSVKDTWGFAPNENRWRKTGDLPTAMFDVAAESVNGTIIIAGGDESAQPYRTTWSVRYSDSTNVAQRFQSHTGWINSPIMNLATTEHGSASLMWMELDGVALPSTSIGFQYRVSDTNLGLEVENWLPIDTANPTNLALLGIGNHSLAALAPSGNQLMQYRIQMQTDNVEDWVVPTLSSIRWSAEEASFSPNNPTKIQSNAPPIVFTTYHGASEEQLPQGATFQFSIAKATADGRIQPGTDWTTIGMNSSGSATVVNDPENLLAGSSATMGPKMNGTRSINWALSFNEIDTSQVLVRTSTFGVANSTYVHPNPVEIDQSIRIYLDELRSDFSIDEDPIVSTNELLAGGSTVSILIDHAYASTGLRPLTNDIKVRANFETKLASFGNQETQTWYNVSTPFTDLNANQPTEITYTLPANVSGETTLRLEAETTGTYDIELTQEDATTIFMIDSFSPIITSTSPHQNEHLNLAENRTVLIELYDVAGFSEEDIETYVWLEGNHDANQNGNADLNERVLLEHILSKNGGTWQIEFYVNETGNLEGDLVRVFLEGNDLDGKSIPLNDEHQSHLQWATRIPTISTIVSVDDRYGTENGLLQRIEPTKRSGWNVVVEDANGIDDITSVRLLLGGDNGLGILYNPIEGCSSLDGRLIVTTDCQGVMMDDQLHISFDFEVTWQMQSAGIDLGTLQIRAYDQDGFSSFDDDAAWTFDRVLTVAINSMEDVSGDVQIMTAGPLTTNAVLKTNDEVEVTGTIDHATSGQPYSGTVALRWNGQFQANNWLGGKTVTVENGVFTTSFNVPETSGKIFDAQLEIWDPNEKEIFHTIEFPDLIVDGDAPVLLSREFDKVSRFDLDKVDIGANVEEPQSWTKELAMTCQVRSTTLNWEPITLARQPIDVFDGRTLFTFRFNFSQSGQPSLLGAQATLNCWASGTDDSGWEVRSEGTNSQESPWVSIPLTSEGPDLQIVKIVFDDSLQTESEVKASVQIFNAGNRVEQSFNVSVYLIKGDSSELIARKTFAGLDSSESATMRMTVDVPEGSWSLQAMIDSGESVAELDETNNQWNMTYDSESQGFSSTILAVSGTSLIAVVALAMILLRRNQRTTNMDKNEDSIEMVQNKDVPIPAKRSGPSNVVTTNAPSRKRGPPPAQPKSTTTVTEQTPAEAAAANFAALDAKIPEKTVERVASWEALPAGGDYEYTSDATYYVGATCGRWKLLDDGQFEKIE